MDYYISLFVFTFVASISPGPNNMMLMASGANHGIRQSIPHYLGICLGFPVMVVLVGLGIDVVFSKYPAIFLYLKIIGVTYLCFLAWKIANAGNSKAANAIKEPFTFIQAAGFQWLNPKAWAIAIGALTAFSIKSNFLLGVLSVTVVYLISGLICMALWLIVGQNLRRFLNTGLRIQYFNVSMAILLLISVIPAAYISTTNGV